MIILNYSSTDSSRLNSIYRSTVWCGLSQLYTSCVITTSSIPYTCHHRLGGRSSSRSLAPGCVPHTSPTTPGVQDVRSPLALASATLRATDLNTEEDEVYQISKKMQAPSSPISMRALCRSELRNFRIQRMPRKAAAFRRSRKSFTQCQRPK